MAILTKIDSNVTGLRYAEELSYKVLPGTPDWVPLEPNSYNDFGGQVTTVARNPINPSRQRKKGVVTDLDASGGFETDITQTNLQDILQGFFFADLRKKGEHEAVTNVDAAGDTYDAAAGMDAFVANDLVFASGFDDAANNGLKLVTAVTAATDITVSPTTLVDDASPATGHKLVHVGHQFAADDLNIDATGSLPTITSDAAFDFTDFGLVPGEWIYVGGDSAATSFATAANAGFARVRAVTATEITLDKTEATFITETLVGGETVQIFFGRVLKNETGTDITRRTYQLERQLGVPADDTPTFDPQAEYITGAVPSEFEFNIPTAEKATAALTFVGADNEVITSGLNSLKTGNRPALVESDAFNTSSDVTRIKMAIVDDTDAAPTALFAFVTDMTLSINNNVSPNKAIGTLGAFEVTAGTFEVGGSVTAYFSEVSAIEAVRNNADVTLDAHMVKSNAGISIDVPLMSLGDGRPDVQQDQAITLPLDMAAATGAKVDTALDHTLLMVFFDYLPSAAE